MRLDLESLGIFAGHGGGESAISCFGTDGGVSQADRFH
jgi:hypothetical protein